MEEQVPLTRREVVYEFMTLQVYRRFRHDQAAREGKQAPDNDAVLNDFIMGLFEAPEGMIELGPSPKLAINISSYT